MLTALLPLAGWAETFPGANTQFTFTWEHVGDNKTATITGFVNGAQKGDITIPATVDFPEAEGQAPTTFNVTGIKLEAFKGETGITSVAFAASSNLTTIGANAFEGCGNMASVDFTYATKLETIGANAFKSTKITALDLSKTKIAEIDNLFGTTADIKNNTLETVKFPATVLSIDANAFLNCNKLKTLNFNGSAEHFAIVAGALAGTIVDVLDLESTKIETINNLFGTKVAATAVENNTLQTVKLPNTWTSIVTRAFENCTALSTISLKPATGSAAAGQAIDNYAFNGAPLTNGLNFDGTTVSAIPANLLMDGDKVKKNTTLQTVTLNATIADLNASFANCEALATVNNLEGTAITTLEPNEFKGDKALATINTSKIKYFGESAFEGCAKLEAIDLGKCTDEGGFGLGAKSFKDAGLKSVTIPKTVTVIPANCFNGCEALATVKFGHGADDDFTSIGEQAFLYNAFSSIIIPATMPLNAEGIATKAFGGCENLKSFTFKPEGAPTATVVNVNAFLGCSDVVFYTTDTYKGDEDVTGVKQPKNVTYVATEAPTETTPFVTTKFANGENKYYIKWKGAQAIKIKKTDAKVYDAWLDDVDNTLNMIQYKTSGGYVYIAAGQVALIITDKQDLSYEAGTANKHTSWIDYDQTAEPVVNDQVLKIVETEEGVSRLDLEAEAGALSIYGWVNSASKKNTGFQKITSGKTFPKGTLYVFANEEEAAAPGLTVVWRDENGNIEETTTAISDIIAEPAQESGDMFNLQGIRVNGAAQKGIYIKNGKKFVVK